MVGQYWRCSRQWTSLLRTPVICTRFNRISCRVCCPTYKVCILSCRSKHIQLALSSTGASLDPAVVGTKVCHRLDPIISRVLAQAATLAPIDRPVPAANIGGQQSPARSIVHTGVCDRPGAVNPNTDRFPHGAAAEAAAMGMGAVQQCNLPRLGPWG